MSKRNADMLIVESVVANEMGTMVPKINRRQARELSRVEPEQRAAVVERAIQATGGRITAAALREAASVKRKTPILRFVLRYESAHRTEPHHPVRPRPP